MGIWGKLFSRKKAIGSEHAPKVAETMKSKEVNSFEDGRNLLLGKHLSSYSIPEIVTILQKMSIACGNHKSWNLVLNQFNTIEDIVEDSCVRDGFNGIGVSKKTLLEGKEAITLYLNLALKFLK